MAPKMLNKTTKIIQKPVTFCCETQWYKIIPFIWLDLILLESFVKKNKLTRLKWPHVTDIFFQNTVCTLSTSQIKWCVRTWVHVCVYMFIVVYTHAVVFWMIMFPLTLPLNSRSPVLEHLEEVWICCRNYAIGCWLCGFKVRHYFKFNLHF